MKKIQHRLFIETNKVDIKKLPQALQKEIYIHNLMLEKLGKLEGKDKADYLLKLEKVDHEIMDDLMEHFEDELEHNNVLEEQNEIYTMKDGFKWIIIGKQKALELFEKNKEVFGIDRQSETESLIENKDELNNHTEFGVEYKKRTQKPKATSKPNPKKVPLNQNSDELIIEKLVTQKQKSIGRSALRTLGFKGELKKSAHSVGKYQLQKALFSYTYYITTK